VAEAEEGGVMTEVYKRSKLQELAVICGYGEEGVVGMIENAVADSVVPGICSNEDCTYSTDVEPDCRKGHCEECGTATVRSCLDMAGVI
jgi:hypothetical protein